MVARGVRRRSPAPGRDCGPLAGEEERGDTCRRAGSPGCWAGRRSSRPRRRSMPPAPAGRDDRGISASAREGGAGEGGVAVARGSGGSCSARGRGRRGVVVVEPGREVAGGRRLARVVRSGTAAHEHPSGQRTTRRRSRSTCGRLPLGLLHRNGFRRSSHRSPGAGQAHGLAVGTIDMRAGAPPRNGPGAASPFVRASRSSRVAASGVRRVGPRAPPTTGPWPLRRVAAGGWGGRHGRARSAVPPCRRRDAEHVTTPRSCRPPTRPHGRDAPEGLMTPRWRADSRGQHERDDSPDERTPGPDRARQRVHVLQRPVASVRPGRSTGRWQNGLFGVIVVANAVIGIGRNGESRPSTGWHCSMHPCPRDPQSRARGPTAPW